MENQGSILLVEDDLPLAEGLQFTLEREGFEVASASSLMEAEESLKNHEFDLVLLDVSLPDGDGFSLCEKIRMKSEVPIIFLTARDDEVDVVRGLETGGDDYVSKPFRVNELLSRIRSVMRRRNPAQPRTIMVSETFRLDRESRRAWRKGIPVDLTPIEWRLLTVLLDAEGGTVPRNRIFQAIWDNDEHYVDDNTLTVHVRRLREKIEENPEGPEHILTVRGVGYRWA